MSHYGRNYKSTWQAVKKTKSGPKKCKSPLSYEAQLLIEAKDQKKARMKGQEAQTESLQVAADT